MAESPKKSALPDFEEIVGIFGKLCSDLKSSVSEIAKDYKAKREEKPTTKATPETKQSPEETPEKEDKTDES